MQFFLNVVTQIHPWERIALKLLRLEYQASMTTADGAIPRDLANFNMSQKRVF